MSADENIFTGQNSLRTALLQKNKNEEVDVLYRKAKTRSNQCKTRKELVSDSELCKQ